MGFDDKAATEPMVPRSRWVELIRELNAARRRITVLECEVLELRAAMHALPAALRRVH